jgi:hypothetical protein
MRIFTTGLQLTIRLLKTPQWPHDIGYANIFFTNPKTFVEFVTKLLCAGDAFVGDEFSSAAIDGLEVRQQNVVYRIAVDGHQRVVGDKHELATPQTFVPLTQFTELLLSYTSRHNHNNNNNSNNRMQSCNDSASLATDSRAHAHARTLLTPYDGTDD